MQLSSLVSIIALLAIPILAIIFLTIKGQADSKIRSITLLVMLVLEMAVSLAASFFGSELVTLSPWGQSMGLGTTLFLFYAYPGFSSIALFCLSLVIITTTHWLMIDQKDSLTVAASLFIATLFALAGNLTAATIVLMLWALLRQTTELDNQERLKIAVTDIVAIVALIIADVLLRANNETSLLSFQKIRGAGMITFAITSLIMLSQGRLRTKTSFSRQTLALLSLVCGGLLWLRLIRLSTAEFPLETTLLLVSLVGALFSAWQLFSKTDVLRRYTSDYWILLLVACGFVMQPDQPQVGMALYATSILATTWSICAPLKQSEQRAVRIIVRTADYCLNGLPGTLGGLAILAFMYNLYNAREWVALILLFLTCSVMIANAWRCLFDPPENEQKRLALPVIIAYALVPTVLICLGLLPRWGSLVGSHLVLAFGYPEYPLLVSWPVYLIWIATIGVGFGIIRLTRSRTLIFTCRKFSFKTETVKAFGTSALKVLGNGLVHIEQALETEWFMPWVLVWFAVISLLLSRS